MHADAATSFELGGGDLAGPTLDEICLLYDAVFSQPPFHWRNDESKLHRERLLSIATDPSFGIAVAREGDDLIGFAYGFALSPATKRWESLRPPVTGDVATERPGRTFLLFDFAVDRCARGRGIGRRLHDTLLGSRPEERATLTVQPGALQTKAIYEHWGWRRLGEMDGGPSAAAPTFDAYLRDGLMDLRQAPTKP